MAINKGIPVINNFDLYAQKPLDSRVVIENEQELGELINKGAIYDGMIFYRKDAQKFFQAQYLDSGLTFTEFGESGENVSPTLILVNFESDSVRATITEEEKKNLDKGLYNQVVYANLQSEIPYNICMPSKLFSTDGEYFFTNFDEPTIEDEETITFKTMSLCAIGIGEKNTTNEYPITIQKYLACNIGGSTSTPKITLTQEQFGKLLLIEDITFTKEQYNTIIESSLVDLYITNDSQSALLYRMNVRPTLDDNGNSTWVLVSNTTKETRYLTQKEANGLVFANTNVSTNKHPITEANEKGSEAHYWQIRFLSTPNVIEYFYTMPDPRNEKNPYVLTSSNGEAKWQILKYYYNHFIYLALETTTKGTATIRINFTTTSNETINTLDKLKSALGETFTLGGNGSIVNGSTYGTTYMLNQNGITGVVNGAQQVFNFADGTLTITDSVKQA